jgi:hypothetical protein
MPYSLNGVYPDKFQILSEDGERVLSRAWRLGEVVGRHIDVTERKRAQEEHERLRRLESDLAHMNRIALA